VLLLLLVTTAAYAPLLRFVLIWDDPIWYGRVQGTSYLSLLRPQPSYHFYRPLTLVSHRLFVRADGTLATFALQFFQLALHLWVVALIVRLCRRLRLAPGLTLATAALFALNPTFYQAVVWAQAPHSRIIALVLLTADLYLLARRRQRWTYLAAALALYLVALLVQEGAVLLLPVLFLLEWRVQGRLRGLARRPALWLFTGLTAAYLGVWSAVPKASGFTGVTMEPQVAWYLLQGLVYPLVGVPGGFPDALLPYVRPLMVVGALCLVGVLLFRRRYFLLLLGGLWYSAALFSTWLGLDYDYVALASRQFYLSGFGAALLWAGALWPRRRAKVGAYLLAGLALLLILGQSGVLLHQFQRLYERGTALQADMLELLAAERDHRLLFVNYPDRYTFRESPYPLGYWGVTLAPAVVDLSDFGGTTLGRAPATESLSVPHLGLDAREAGPYVVDMRGSPVDESEVYAAALEADGIYLTRYHTDGRMTLHYAGDVAVQAAADEAPLLTIPERAALVDLQAAVAAGTPPRLTLRWRVLGPGEPADVLFAHLVPGATPVKPLAQADGAPALSTLPLRTWQAGHVVEEVRTLSPVEGPLQPGTYTLALGIYNWQRETRYPAVGPQGEAVPEGWVPVTRLTIPAVVPAP
jgi:hypothetical protein